MSRLARCRPEVPPGLADLRVPIGGWAWRRTVVHVGRRPRCGVAVCLDGWAASVEEGVRKPARRLLEIAAARCGVASPADGGWCVGDDPTADIGGGRAAGPSTIRVWRIPEWPVGSAGRRLRRIIGSRTYSTRSRSSVRRMPPRDRPDPAGETARRPNSRFVGTGSDGDADVTANVTGTAGGS
ncbi:HAD family hydrolase [Embleya hyalina]|uniref:HAD family hydrolase n=1 Tax=Embleya hyalina TaxID=516124 RepID=UPI000F84370D|nr:HAD hydrolase-like protein [Embleya hyalina]